MIIRFLKDTDYEPVAGDSPRCYGQLKKRATAKQIEKDGPDGTRITKTICGPMAHYFKAGSTPELSDTVAQKFIDSGVAEPYDGHAATFVSREQIMDIVQQ